MNRETMMAFKIWEMVKYELAGRKGFDFGSIDQSVENEMDFTISQIIYEYLQSQKEES